MSGKYLQPAWGTRAQNRGNTTCPGHTDSEARLRPDVPARADLGLLALPLSMSHLLYPVDCSRPGVTSGQSWEDGSDDRLPLSLTTEKVLGDRDSWL